MVLLKGANLLPFIQNGFWNYPYSLIELLDGRAKCYAQTKNSDAMVIPMFIVEGQLNF